MRPSLLLAVLLAPPVARGAPLPLTLDPSRRAQIRFSIAAPLDEIVGVSTAVSGQVRYDDATGQGSGRIEVDLSRFRTGIRLRDRDLRKEFFQVDRYPKAVLDVDALDPALPGLLAPGRDVAADALGSLTLHGVTRRVRVPMTFRAGSRAGRPLVSAKGKLEVRYEDFGIPRPRMLFLKLGRRVEVEIALAFVGPPGSPGPAIAAVDLPDAGLFHPGAVLPVAHLARPRRRRLQFAADTPEGRGERLLDDPGLGGPGNALTCLSCHATGDETERGDVGKDGTIRPAWSLWDAAHRPKLWQGLAPDAGSAAALCARLFMLAPGGIDRGRRGDLGAYLGKISPDDVAPPLDYRVLAMTRKTGLKDPVKGDPARGRALVARFCESCHAEGAVRPPLTPGLYEADDIVSRVRWLDRVDSHQMPPFDLARLPDAELRDIVTYLAGNEKTRIFQREHPVAATP